MENKTSDKINAFFSVLSMVGAFLFIWFIIWTIMGVNSLQSQVAQSKTTEASTTLQSEVNAENFGVLMNYLCQHGVPCSEPTSTPVK